MSDDDIEAESGDYESTTVRHSLLNDPEDLVREVRWYRDSGNAYRYSEHAGDWVYLGSADSLSEAKNLAAQDMYVIHKP